MATAHTLEQPGLQSGSWDSENDLMKRFVVEITPEGGIGWLAILSFDNYTDAYLSEVSIPFTRFRIWDQFENKDVWN